jgi:hypothetical protein
MIRLLPLFVPVLLAAQTPAVVTPRLPAPEGVSFRVLIIPDMAEEVGDLLNRIEWIVLKP